jgi:poly(3-hydroxybutyrate) depolymerase
MNLRIFLVAVMIALLPVTAVAQALTSLTSLWVRYNTRKNTVKPEGELKAQLASLDREVAEATRLGQSSESRRLLAKGMTLLDGKPWTDVADFGASLVVRTDRVIIDSGKPGSFRIEQIYRPTIELTRALSGRVSLRPFPAVANTTMIKALGTFEGVGRDLRDVPFFFETDLRDVADGVYQLNVEVMDENRLLGTATLTIAVRKGLDETMGRLESAAATASETVRPDILFPLDRMRSVNRGRLELRTFNLDRDIAAAEAIAATVRSGGDPYAGRTGDFKRHYYLDAAQEIMPYRLFVPKAYIGTKAFPLIIPLHGLGGTEDVMFDGYGKRMTALAEERGYIVAAPFGYRVDGGYGWGVGSPPPDAVLRRVQELSERDVMEVLRRVQQAYNIDGRRVYLMGHSMGGIGTWKLAAKYPDVWAALAPFAGYGAPGTLEGFRHIPEFVVHGDADQTVPVGGSRAMVARLKELGAEVLYVEVPGGDHGNVVAPNFPAMFNFFDVHQKAAARVAK